MSIRPQKLAATYLRHTLRGSLTLANVRRALEQQGYTLIRFNGLVNDGPTDTVIRSLGLQAQCRCSRGFTYAGGDCRLVFVHEDLSEQEELLVLLHEQGHILCNHLEADTVIGQDVAQEFEANEFLHYVLKVPLRTRLCRFVKAHRTLFICLGSALVALAVTAAIVLFNRGNQRFYITATGNRYHTAECHYVEDREGVSSQPRSWLEENGYTPCDRCTP